MRAHFGNVYITGPLSQEKTKRVKDSLWIEPQTPDPKKAEDTFKALQARQFSDAAIGIITRPEQTGPAVITTTISPTTDHRIEDTAIRRVLGENEIPYVTIYGEQRMRLPGEQSISRRSSSQSVQDVIENAQKRLTERTARINRIG